ncbi:ATP-dependent DNA helicase [Xanthomonas arboricola pv. fragariae]|uniref:UvrD-helicase domain-containing protein n=1 Tax=Xanthomonas arboricola TaxID=56448 RepID=UPI000CB9B107|nr:ATP-dependent helicase [Xanthomonas arboricola]SOT95460.1 ATP-dependent DNA helicase [Xanthomonas arboricola pv. fragariae]
MRLLESLSEEQMEVVKFSGNILLTACPGSGKTRTVAAKIAHRISSRRGFNKRWILAITHTRVAADEIHERLDKSGIEDSQLWIGTIHSFCLEWIIKPFAGLNKRVSKGFRVIDEHEQRQLIRRIKAQLGITSWGDFPTRVDRNFMLPENLHSSDRDAAVLYHEALLSGRLIDFDLILSIAQNMVLVHPEIGRRLAGVFESIMVDEYQDLSQQQYDIISSITRAGISEIMLVGDADQAIFTTLEAVVKRIDALKEQLSLRDMTEFHLTGCYRSSQKIIDFYQRFQEVPYRIASLKPNVDVGSSVSYCLDIDRTLLPGYLARLIEGHLERGVSASEIVILAPSWRDAAWVGRQLRPLLPDIKIDCPNSSPLPNSFENPWHSLTRLITTPAGPENYGRRRRIAQAVSLDLMGMGVDLEGANPTRVIMAAANSVSRPSGGGISDFIRGAVEQFCSSIGVDISAAPQLSINLNAYLAALADRIEFLEVEDNAYKLFYGVHATKSCKVKTFHSTKGEEYEVVIATGLLVGKMPHWNDVIDKPKAHTDYITNRLLYVAASRAIHYLHLISEAGHRTKRGAPLRPTPQIRWGATD